MEFRQRALLSLAILIGLIIILYTFTDWFSKVTGYFTGEDEKTKLAQCLQGKGAELYTGTDCKDCEKQEDVFGNSIKFIKRIECETNLKGELIDEKCQYIREVPAWYINKTITYGFKNMTELQEISGCIEPE